MSITSEHMTGFAVGIGVAAVGLYLYKKNEAEVDEFLRKQGIKIPCCAGSEDVTAMTLEELVLKKESLEDFIAEKELSAKSLELKEEPQV